VNTKNIRIKDIATLAGVSTGTVDRVLHKRGRVSKAAEEKVRKILDEIDYKPNPIARSLGSNKKYKIIALIPDPAKTLIGNWLTRASSRPKPNGPAMGFRLNFFPLTWVERSLSKRKHRRY